MRSIGTVVLPNRQADNEAGGSGELLHGLARSDTLLLRAGLQVCNSHKSSQYIVMNLLKFVNNLEIFVKFLTYDFKNEFYNELWSKFMNSEEKQCTHRIPSLGDEG